jgi:hypothetical protein
MNSWASLTFLVVFLGQIFFSSYYVPKRILARLDRLRTDYPPERYPKLYPRSAESFSASRSLFQWSSRAVFALGFVLLYGAVVMDGADGYISEAWPAAYGLMQFMPLLVIELLGFRQFRLMREANTDTTRKADLRPRRLFDSVSPALLVQALELMISVFCLVMYVNDFHLAWGSDAVQQAIVMLVSNLALVVVGLFQFHGRKLNPHQSARDRTRQTRAQLTSLLLLSCAMSVFFIWQTAGDAFPLHDLDAAAMSLYFQLIVALSIGFVLRSLRFEDIDFEVYAAKPGMEKKHV